MGTMLTYCARIGLAAGLMLVALPAAADKVADPLLEGARQCTQYFPVEEKKNNIPTHLLAAIATTESGRWHTGLGMNVPWPWTINVEGKGYFFDSKAEAIAQTRSLLAKGHQSIDVGCMQVNLKHHPKAFADLNQAFDPSTNVAYSAKFLRENYATLGDWIKATAAYHSRTPVYGQRYLAAIERSWNNIVGKVTAARTGGAEPSKTASVTAPATTTQKPPVVVAAARPAPAVSHARVIQVHEAPRASASPVMVVRAAPTASQTAPVAVAEAAPVAVAQVAPVATQPEVVGDSVRRVRLDNPTAAAVASKPVSGPQFVFAN